MAQNSSIAGPVSAALFVTVWPSPALAQDIAFAVVVVGAPAALAAPVVALFAKKAIVKRLSRRRLMAAAFVELLLWALFLPAGGMVELRMLGLDYRHSAVVMLVVCSVGALTLNCWVLASGSGQRRLAVAMLFTALTPLAFLAIGGALIAAVG